MSTWEHFTDIQADAVHATAAKHLRDPEDLAAELAPLFLERPVRALETRTVSVDFTLSPESAASAWSLLGHTSEGFQVFARSATGSVFAVNDTLTEEQIA